MYTLLVSAILVANTVVPMLMNSHDYAQTATVAPLPQTRLAVAKSELLELRTWRATSLTLTSQNRVANVPTATCGIRPLGTSCPPPRDKVRFITCVNAATAATAQRNTNPGYWSKYCDSVGFNPIDYRLCQAAGFFNENYKIGFCAARFY